MAAVTGPVSTLAGAHHVMPKGTMCDTHGGRLATHRVQGETDSFGSELHDMCAECYAEHKVAMAKYRAEMAVGCCDWCKQAATDLRDKRDFEEGMAGPVYRVCGACCKREADDLAEEAEQYNDDRGIEYVLDSWHDDDGYDDFLADMAADADANMEGPQLPVEALPPQGYPRAYVDGRFIY